MKKQTLTVTIVCCICCTLLSSPLLSQAGPTGGQGFHEDCQGSCNALGSNGAECWNNHIHGDGHRSDSEYGGTGNCGHDLTTGANGACGVGTGSAVWVWLNGHRTSSGNFSCQNVGSTSVDCRVNFSINCNGQTFSRTDMRCQGTTSDMPVVIIERDRVMCDSNGGSGVSEICSCSSSGMDCRMF